MYSVVLMMAVTTSGDAVDCHRHSRVHGCCGGTYVASCSGGCYGASSGCCGGVYYAPVPKGEPLKMPKPGDKKPEDKKPEELKTPDIGGRAAPAKIIVSLPADATLTIDEYTSPARSDMHIVMSSPLGVDQTRTYVLKAKAFRDGKMQTVEEQVTVRGGEEKNVTLTLPTTVAAR
jgi:uncharacterized protein (TIGR03000 family)